MTTLSLGGRDYELQPPTMAAFAEMADHGVNFLAGGVDIFDPRTLTVCVAAILTDSSPLTPAGKPADVWTPERAGKLLDMRDLFTVAELIADLIADALPGGKRGGEGVADPTEAGETK